jgi:hypothetical protein
MTTIEERIDEVLVTIRAEVLRAMKKHPCTCKSAHHHFAVLKEEVDELWDNVKTDDTEGADVEAVHVGAMAVRFIVETWRE